MAQVGEARELLAAASRRRRRLAAMTTVVAAVLGLTGATLAWLGPRTQPPTPPVPTTRGLDLLLASNTVRLASGESVPIPAGAGEQAVAAWRVRGGWLVLLQRDPKDQHLRLLTEDGRLSGFDAAVDGADVAIAAGGTGLAATRSGVADVYDLPSRAHRAHADVSGFLRDGGFVSGLFLTDHQVIVQVSHGPAGALMRSVVLDLTSSQRSVIPRFQALSVSRDGTLAAGLSWPAANAAGLRWPAPDPVDLGCLAVVAIASPGLPRSICPEAGAEFAAAAFSPDGRAIAVRVWTGPRDSTVWVYPTNGLRAGHASPVRLRAPQGPGTVTLQWLDNQTIVFAQAAPEPVYVCTLTGAGCVRQSLPADALATVPDLR